MVVILTQTVNCDAHEGRTNRAYTHGVGTGSLASFKNL